jgi:hypothetical protein
MKAKFVYEHLMTRNIDYDYAFDDEKIVDQYNYCGYNVKIAQVGELYYGIADTGEPLFQEPDFHKQRFAAEGDIEAQLSKVNVTGHR